MLIERLPLHRVCEWWLRWLRWCGLWLFGVCVRVCVCVREREGERETEREAAV